jgi:hypothetical protein
MAYHNTSGWSRRDSRPEPESEPSWATVIANTVRLWAQRHPFPGSRGVRSRRGVLLAGLVVAAVVAGVFIGRAATSPSAASTSAAQGTAPGSTSSGALGSAIAARDQAAQWVAQQVAASAIVSCDPAMCAALQADGIPAARLLVVGINAADPLGSDVVVETPALRNQFGSRLATVYAPAVIASFSSGAARIDVRALAPSGAAAYETALTADLRARAAAGQQLLRNSRIVVSSAARATLRSGNVDSRLLITLAALAAQQPFQVIAFDDASPGASAAPLRGAVLGPAQAGAQTTAQLRSMLSFLDAQQDPFLPLHASIASNSGLSFEYAAPSPLGELGTP